MKKSSSTLFVLFLLCMFIGFSGYQGASAQTVSLSVAPAVAIPISPDDMYTLEAGAAIDLRLLMPSAALEGIARLGYGNLVIQNDLGNVSLVTLEAGAFWPAARGERAAIGPVAFAGGYGAFMDGTSALFNPMVEGGLRAEFSFTNIQLALEPGMEFFFARESDNGSTFLTTAALRFIVTFTPRTTNVRPQLKIDSPNINPFFPVIYKYYAGNAVGSVKIINRERTAIHNVEVTFFVPAYMDGPQTIASITALKAGQSVEIPVKALFKNTVLGVTETDSAQTQLHVAYTVGNDEKTVVNDGTMRIEGRNGIVWYDDRIAAAFVTAKDPTILKLSRNVVAVAPKKGILIPSEAYRNAAIVFDALEAYKLAYVVDPKGSYATMKNVKEAVDYLQFPVETLAYRTGDCDDLSTLYLSMLEAVGIETAFITVPGHIFSAFALDISDKSLASAFADPDRFIHDGGKIWVPVETTALGSGFETALDIGRKEWKEGVAKNAARVVSVHDAWQIYEPSFISSDEQHDVVSKFPDVAKIAEKNTGTIRTLSDKELNALISSILKSEGQNPSAVATNRVGAVYARYGAVDKAESYFREAADKGSIAAQCNLGNLLFLRKEYSNAAVNYRKTLLLKPDYEDATLGLARALYESGKYPEAAAQYTALKQVDPEKASAFSYLDASGTSGTARAADQKTRTFIDWSN